MSISYNPSQEPNLTSKGSGWALQMICDVDSDFDLQHSFGTTGLVDTFHLINFSSFVCFMKSSRR